MHPACFSPDDKFSEYRVEAKLRFNLLKLEEEEGKGGSRRKGNLIHMYN